MKREQTDIFISGGGVAGLAAAVVFGTAGFRVICVDPAPPIVDGRDAGADLRTTAFLQPARDLLGDAGLWDTWADQAMALNVMRIVDAAQMPPVIRDFDSADIGDQPFGWNLRNWVLRRDMITRLSELETVDFRTGVGFRGMVAREDTALVTMTDRTQVEARLVIGADGRDSPVRAGAGIGAKTTHYGQKALTFAVTHTQPHQNISTEIHRSGGPFTLVPLPDHEGQPCSAVVWMTDGAEAERVMALETHAFNAAATTRSADHYGPLQIVTHRQSWPIISRIADRLDAPRTALMAEAAHVMPPIGAQGLNTSLADVQTLRDLAVAEPDQLGSRAMLAKYNRARHADIKLRAAGISMLNRTSQAGNPLMQALRARGVGVIHDIKPVRTALMKLGLGR